MALFFQCHLFNLKFSNWSPVLVVLQILKCFPCYTAGQDQSKSVNVVFVSLLRKGTPDRDRNEGKLASAFAQVCLRAPVFCLINMCTYNTLPILLNARRMFLQAVGLMGREHKLPVSLFPLDWHEMDKQLGTHEVIEALWSMMNSTVHSHGFSLGQYMSEAADKKGEDVHFTDYALEQSGYNFSSNISGLAVQKEIYIPCCLGRNCHLL